MSFLIEDILNTKNSNARQSIEQNQNVQLNFDSCPNVSLAEKKSDPHNSMNLSFGDQSSILHRTLLNRINSPYYRTGEPRGPPIENYHHLCYDPSYLNYYRCTYDRDYSSLQRQKPWTSSPYDSQANYLSYAMQYKYLYSPSKRKGGQVRFTANQTDILEKKFCSNKYLSPEERKILAESLRLSDRQVKTWFQNRRAKWRRSNSTEEQTDEEITKTTEN